MATRPARRRDDRDHRSGRDADRPARAAGGARPASPTSGSRSSSAGARCPRGGRPGARRAVRPGLHRRAQARVRRLPRGAHAASRPGALVLADNVLWSGRASGARPSTAGDANVAALRAFDAARPRRPALLGRRSCRSATACCRQRGSADGRRPAWHPHPGPALRAPARAGGHPRGARRAARASTVESAWAALVTRYPVLAPGRPSVRFARNGDYADATTALADGDEVAMIPPVSRRRRPIRILELRERPFDATILAELAARLAEPEDGAIVGFLGRTRSTPGTPAPGQEAEAARHAGRTSRRSSTRRSRPMAAAVLGTHRRRDRGALRGRPPGDRPSDRRRAARRGLDRRRGRRPAPRCGLRRGPLRHRRDEGARSRSGRPSGSPTATSGSATPRVPDRRRTR